MKKIVFTLIFLVTFITQDASATTLIHKSLEKCTLEAEEIFEGKVVSIHTQHSKDKKTIYTYVTFARLKHVKGKAVPSKTLRFEGGCVGDDCLTIARMPTFKAGEQVILFVSGNLTERTICPVVGWDQGKFSVEVDQATGKEVMRNGFGGKVTGFDAEKGELVTEALPQRERVVPIPANGSPDQLVSPRPESTQMQSESAPLTKSDFLSEINQVIQKQANERVSVTSGSVISSNALHEREAVSPPKVSK